MSVLDRSVQDLLDLLGSNANILDITPVGVSGILIVVVQTPENAIEVWKVKP